MACGILWRLGGVMGGIVSSVGVNAPITSDLAVDPEATVGPIAVTGPRGPSAFEPGPSVTVTRKEPASSDRTRPSGRFRLPK